MADSRPRRTGLSLPIEHSILSPFGTLARVPFLCWGVGLMGLKATVDALVAGVFFGRSWSLSNYLSQHQVLQAFSATRGDLPYLAVLLTLSLPFVWIGICLTVKRLRDAGLPLGLALLFFLPTINLVFFAMLCTVRSRRAPTGNDEHESDNIEPVDRPGKRLSFAPVIPRSTIPRAIVTLGTTSLLGLLLAGFNIYGLRVYGMGLFVGLPFAVGLLGAVIHGYHHDRTVRACIGVGLLSVITLAGAMVLISMEGAICILMAAPLWLGCAALGGLVGVTLVYASPDDGDLALLVTALVLGIPALMGAERALLPVAPVYSVTTTLEIPATRDEVWNRVVSFPPLDSPHEWIFKMGVAYPIGAEIDGAGPCAIRRCQFSTGAFVEPIEVWNPPELLKFSVTDNPMPMREWSLWGDIHPPHLDGFFVSQAGQFRLIESANGVTLLEGTTWYQHHMWPAEYWRVPSDYIIHTIHRRVLNHIRQLCINPSKNP